MSGTVKFGDPVRARCGATGRHLGYRDLVLYVCAQDNDLGLDEADHDREPWDKSPLPSIEACMAANIGISAGLRGVGA